jgi:hypothetical protein
MNIKTNNAFGKCNTPFHSCIYECDALLQLDVLLFAITSHEELFNPVLQCTPHPGIQVALTNSYITNNAVSTAEDGQDGQVIINGE